MASKWKSFREGVMKETSGMEFIENGIVTE